MFTLAQLRKEGNVLFNDALNTYGITHMVKDHSDRERGNLLPPHGLLFSINSKGSFICTIRQTGLHIPRLLLHQSWSYISLLGLGCGSFYQYSGS